METLRKPFAYDEYSWTFHFHLILCVTFMQPAVCVIELNAIFNTKQHANTRQMMSILLPEQAPTTPNLTTG